MGKLLSRLWDNVLGSLVAAWVQSTWQAWGVGVILASLGTYALQQAEQIPLTASVLVFVGIVLVAMISAQILFADNSVGQRVAIQTEVGSAKSQHKIKVHFGAGGSFEEVNGFDREVHRLFRVAVTNVDPDANTIKDVRVLLEKIETYDNPFLPVPLYEMHDTPRQDQEFRITFDLNPGETRYVNVTGKQEGLAGTGEIYLCYASRRSNMLPDGRYVLRLTVTGKDVPAERLSLVAEVNDGALSVVQLPEL